MLLYLNIETIQNDFALLILFVSKSEKQIKVTFTKISKSYFLTCCAL